MIIIAFEGLDKSGKATEAELLYKALYERGYSVEKSEFHNYSSPTGQLIRRFLDGEYSPNQLAIECIMAADKYAQLDWFNELAENTDVLILDRYLSSQLVYSTANGIDTDFSVNLLSKMPEPDYHVFLDIEPKESMERKGEHGANDKYESNKQLLKDARNLYLKLMEEEVKSERAIILDGTKTVNELHEEILSWVLSLLEDKPEEKKVH